MHAWKIVVGVLALTTASGCITHTEFEPMSAVSSPQVAQNAVRFYPNDEPALRAAGGELIGTVASRGNGYTSQGVLSDRALSEAAEHGGTHVMLADKGFDRSYFTTDGSASTNCYNVGRGVNCNSTITPGQTYAINRPHASFVVVRVPPEHWAELPLALRPAPIPGLVVPSAPPPPAQAPQAPQDQATPTAAAAP